MSSDNLEILHELLDETGEVLVAVEDSLATLHTTTVDLTLLLTDTRPLIDDTAQVITQDVPQALDDVQTSMPSLIETAAAVDETLTFLSGFQLTIPNPFGEAFKIGLGVDYAPEVPLDDALVVLSGNLEGIPEDLRDLENDFKLASTNVLTLRDDLAVMADDLYEINQQIEDLGPLVGQMAEDVQISQNSVEEYQHKLDDLANQARIVYVVFFSLILLAQVPGIYAGVMILRGYDQIRKEDGDHD